MTDSNDDTLNAMEPPSLSNLIYRCVCGHESKVDMVHGGICPHCKRVVNPEAIRQAMSATVTIGDLANATALQFPDPLEDDPYSGTTLGHFKLDRPLGRGGMGTVYRALDTSLQRYVAVKVVRDSHLNSTSEEKVSSMLQEAIAQARINHPNVVTIYYVGRQDNLPFLAMELVSGPTLNERLKAGPVPYADAIRIGLKVADALRHAHQFGIVHADIKPSNLLLCENHFIKLSDFGLSRMNTNDQAAGKIAGTPSHLAPEIVQGESVSIHSDMYALGVTLFELLFGRLPFALVGNSVRERLETHQHAVVEFPEPWPKEIPVEVKGVLEKLLAKSPQERYSNYEGIIKDLSRLLPVNRTPAGLAPRVMAYAADQIMLIAFMTPFVLAVAAMAQVEDLAWVYWMIPWVGLLSFVPPATYLIAIRNGWRSLGCYLFQLRTVDQHGLVLRQDLRLTRELLRCMFSWLFPLSFFAGLFWPGIDRLLDVAILLFFGIDTASFFVTKERRTLHDWLTGAQVVLDVDRNPESRNVLQGN